MDQMKITIEELPKEGKLRVYKISSEKEVLGVLRIIKNLYIWSVDLFAETKISRKTAINYFNNAETIS